MATEKQIQAAVTKYRKLKADFDRLYLQVGKAEMRYKEAERKYNALVKKSQEAARKSSDYRDSLVKKGIYKEVIRRV